ncbi:hypothetical protein PAHAL_3G140800 [Panicum hallii]|jgi:hypothetical protein|uniref:Myb/SANT-like domain-containing protein n=1 Tax=Panicum hallii TaxID=206008 RepID=A0A2T8KI49_9POAL|nr:hypothetical protein PAHAL_3G140800 [Panicum hallii]
MDPLRGNNTKSDKYWTEVQEEYNQATVKNRWRTTKQVKDRWYKINKLTNLFNDCWLKAKRVYTGGYSDEMWLEKAHKFFEEENKGLRFQLTNVWYMVRNEAKWMSYNDHSQGKRKEMEKGSTQEGGLEDVTSLCGACSYAMAAALITLCFVSTVPDLRTLRLCRITGRCLSWLISVMHVLVFTFFFVLALPEQLCCH